MLSLAIKQRVGPTWQNEIARVTCELVLAFVRVGKTWRTHGRGDPKLLGQLETCAREFHRTTERPVRLLMLRDQLFLDGELLPYHKDVQTTLAGLLDMVGLVGGGIEVYVQQDFDPRTFETWQAWFGRKAGDDEPLVGTESCFVRARSRERSREPFRALHEDAASLRVQKARTDTRSFAAALVALSYVFERASDVAWSRQYAPAVLRRAAATLTACAVPDFVHRLGLADITRLAPSLSVRAGHSAILAAATTRQVTSDRRTLRDVALGALLLNFARAASDKEHRLISALELAALTSAVCVSLGFGESPAAILAHEAAQLTAAMTGASSQRASLPARVVGIAEGFVEESEAGASADDRIGAIAYRVTDPSDQTILRMLAAALGHLPAGTSVELETGETATVVSEGDDETTTYWLSIVMSSEGQILANPRRVRLSGGPKITTIVSTEGWARAPATGPLGHGTDHGESTAAFYPEARTSRPDDIQKPISWGVASVGGVASRVSAAPSIRPSTQLIGATLPPEDIANRVPTASGTLAGSPLPHLIVYMLDHRLKGSVVLTETGGAEHIIYFRRGVPVAVSHHTHQHRIGEILFARLGLVEKALSEAAERAKEHNRLLGEELVDEGKVDSATVASAVRLQIVLRLEALSNLAPSTTFAFYKGIDLTGHGRGRSVHVHPLDAAMAAVRSWKNEERVVTLVERLRGQTLTLHEDARLEWIWLSPEELRVVRELGNGRSTLDDLINSDVADQATVRRVVYAMAITRQFTLATASKKPMGASIAPSMLMMDDTSVIGANEASEIGPLLVPPIAALTRPNIEGKQVVPPAAKSSGSLIPRRPSIRPKAGARTSTNSGDPAPSSTALLVAAELPTTDRPPSTEIPLEARRPSTSSKLRVRKIGETARPSQPAVDLENTKQESKG